MDPPEVQVGIPGTVVTLSDLLRHGCLLLARLSAACPSAWGRSKCSEVSYVGLEPQAQVGAPPSALSSDPCPVPGGIAGRFLTVADAAHGCRPALLTC